MQHDIIPAFIQLPHLAVIFGNEFRDLGEDGEPFVCPDQTSLRSCCGMEAFAVVDLVELAVHCLCGDEIMSLVEEPETFRQAYIGDGVEGEEVCVGAVVEGKVLRNRCHAFLQGLCTAFICGFDESNGLVCDFVFPSFQVLEGVGAGENASLSLVIEFVPDICEVVMRPSQSIVKYVLDTFCVVSVNVLHFVSM